MADADDPAETADAGLWRLDTPPADAKRAVTALEPSDLADCFVTLKIRPGRAAAVKVFRTRGGETTPLVSLAMPDGANGPTALYLLNLLHDLAHLAAGGKVAG